jgi:hypothetical protein
MQTLTKILEKTINMYHLPCQINVIRYIMTYIFILYLYNITVINRFFISLVKLYITWLQEKFIQRLILWNGGSVILVKTCLSNQEQPNFIFSNSFLLTKQELSDNKAMDD